jgi:cellulose biosynthesis protein BcsQ
MENIDWLRDELGEYDNDYILIDCPGTFRFFALPALIFQFRQA